MEAPSSRTRVLEMDARDPLAAARSGFELPDGLIYLDGNSLGPPPASAARRLGEVLGEEWAGDLVRSWTRHEWIDLPQRVAAAIAPLVGAGADEVMVADSVSVNLFKLLGAALPKRCLAPLFTLRELSCRSFWTL